MKKMPEVTRGENMEVTYQKAPVTVKNKRKPDVNQ
jgi:hypothetical protein